MDGVLPPFRQLPYFEVPDEPRVAHRYFDTEARDVAVDSAHFGKINVHVRVYGEGPPLLLVHGLMTTSYSWRYVLEPLGRHFTLYAPDLPGCGRSDKPDVSYPPEALSMSIAEIMDALGIRGAPAIGNSLGGYLTMMLALRDEGAFSRLVNLHGPGLPTGRMHLLAWGLKLLPAHEAVLKALVWRDPERWVHQNVHYFDETLKSREEHREYATPLKSEAGVRAFARYMKDTLDVDAMKRYASELEQRGSFPVPLLLVYVPRDPMVPPEIGDRYKALLPDATLVKLKRGSHFAHVDATDAFVDAVIPFLRV